MRNKYLDFIPEGRGRYILSWLSVVPLVGLVGISPSYGNILVEAVPSLSPQKELSQMGDRCSKLKSECAIPLAQISPSQYNVQRIIVTGSTIFREEEFLPIIQKFSGKEVTEEELDEAVDAITQLYLEREFLTSEAILVKESLNTGVVEILVIEGGIEEIRVEGVSNLNPNYIRKRVRLGATTPLNPKKLEEQLRLLRTNPLVENIEASLRKGTGLNQSILVVRVTEANRFSANVAVDNYSPPSVGSEQITVGGIYRNLSGIGDSFATSYKQTLAGGANTWDLSYQLPLNAMNGTLTLRGSINSNEVIQEPFDALGIEGESDLFEIAYRQPLIRDTRQELALSFGFTYQDGQTFIFDNIPQGFGFGPDEDGVSRTSVFQLGQEYIRRSQSGSWSLRSQFSLGTKLFNATENTGDIPDGQFFSWLGQIQRVQIFSPDNFLIIQGDIQLTPDTLLPSQQFVIGGGQSVRGFRQNFLAGDQGIRLSIEDRITLQRNETGSPSLQLAPFVDAGVAFNQDDNPNSLSQNQNVIVGIGLGVLLQPLPGLNLRVDYGVPLTEIENRGNNAQEEGLYFSVNYGL